jgi:uncharacterized protein (UPF0276 family)
MMKRPRGHGYGVRAAHYAELLERGARAEYLEAISENFLGRGGRPAAVLERLRRDAEIVLHGVSLSIGSVDPLARNYVRELGGLARAIEAAWVSDHLCFGSFGGHYAHDLWPLPYTEEALAHVAARVAEVQELLGRQILLENVSSYVAYRASVMTEWEFLTAVAERADCLILLDVNNVYVSARNHDFPPERYIDALPGARIAQLHLAGHSDQGTHVVDDHGSRVCGAVWDLYRHTLRRFGPVPVIVEWDENLPPLELLEAEVATARAIEGELYESGSA